MTNSCEHLGKLIIFIGFLFKAEIMVTLDTFGTGSRHLTFLSLFFMAFIL